jgi:hypothetical protein
MLNSGNTANRFRRRLQVAGCQEIGQQSHATPISSAAPEALFEVLAELLDRAQLAGAVRCDIEVGDVVALLMGTAYAICHSRAGEERTRRLLALMDDGLRTVREDR